MLVSRPSVIFHIGDLQLKRGSQWPSGLAGFASIGLCVGLTPDNLGFLFSNNVGSIPGLVNFKVDQDPHCDSRIVVETSCVMYKGKGLHWPSGLSGLASNH